MTALELPSIASLCAGYGGLERGVAEAIGGANLTWYSEIEPAACRLLEHHHPGVVNVGDLTAATWADCAEVDLLTAGWPCQPWSLNGLGLGVDDPRHLWPYIGRGQSDESGRITKPGAIAVLRPRLFVGENVLGHLSRGFVDVVADLHVLGYDAYWTTWSAADVGAPHPRGRLFVLGVRRDSYRSARPARAALLARHGGGQWLEPHEALFGVRPFTDRLPNAGAQIDGYVWAVEQAGQVPFPFPLLPTPKASDGERGGGPAEAARNSPSLVAIAHLLREGPRSRSLTGAVKSAPFVVADDADSRWGVYAPAIRRWETTLGRAAPAPTVTTARGNEQLRPAMPEWMMGLPEGHITAVPGLSRAEQIKLAGNGVMPAQCAAAVRWLLAGSAVWAGDLAA